MARRLRILISACLLGVPCRYDGGEKGCAAVLRLADRHEVFPVCPEQLGGLPTPRTPCERVGDRVLTQGGQDRTREYARGALAAARLFDVLSCDCALLKERSPMCGCGQVYDGTFSGRLTQGDGVLAQRLREMDKTVCTESNMEIIDRLSQADNGR